MSQWNVFFQYNVYQMIFQSDLNLVCEKKGKKFPEKSGKGSDIYGNILYNTNIWFC